MNTYETLKALRENIGKRTFAESEQLSLVVIPKSGVRPFLSDRSLCVDYINSSGEKATVKISLSLYRAWGDLDKAITLLMVLQMGGKAYSAPYVVDDRGTTYVLAGVEDLGLYMTVVFDQPTL